MRSTRQLALVLCLLTIVGSASLGFAQVLLPQSGGTSIIGAGTPCPIGQIPKANNGIWECADDAGAGTGAPTSATYLTQTPDGSLSAEQALSVLASGIMINATTTGVVSIYTGGSCTNQVIEDLSAFGVPTCVSIGTAYLAAGAVTNEKVAAGAAIDKSKISTTGMWGASQIDDLPASKITSGTFDPARLPLPSAGAVGGVRSIDCSDTQQVNAIGVDGIPICNTDEVGYDTVADEGTPLTKRPRLNLTGAGVTCTDDAVNSETDCDVPGGGVGSIDGTGTAGTVAGWQDANTLEDSPISYAGGTTTVDDDLTVVGRVSSTPQAVTCSSSGDANPGALTLQPARTVVHITNSDPDGCAVTMSETAPITGSLILVSVVSSVGGTVNFTDSAGVLEMFGGQAFAMIVGDTLVLEYFGSAFQEVGRSVFPTLQQLPQRKLTDAVSLATALSIEDGTSYIRLFIDPTNGPTIATQCDGDDCPIILDAPTGKVIELRTSDITRLRVETDGSVTLFGVRGRLVWDSDSMKPDGTHCKYSDDQTVNTGPIDNFITCTENAAQKVSLKKYILPPNFSGTTLGFVLHATDVDALSHVLAFNIEAMCRTPGTDTIDNTWSTGVAIATPALAVAHRPYKSSEIIVTPNGSCVGGDWLFVRLMANTVTNTDDANARLAMVEAFFTISELMQ